MAIDIDSSIDMDTMLAPCGAAPNCVCSVYDSALNEAPKWYIEPMTYDTTADNAVEKAFAKLEYVLADLGLSVETADFPLITATASTRILRFVDDLRFVFDVEKGLVHVRSESRVGYYDFVKNRRRLETIRNLFAPATES